MYYTLGQRKGLGIGGIRGINADGGYFIYKKDVMNNILYVAKVEDSYLLESDKAIVDNVNWIGPKPTNEIEVGVKFRYRQADQKAKLHFEGEKIVLDYSFAPVKAVTPGQIAAIYQGERMLGGGIIDAIYRQGKRIDL